MEESKIEIKPVRSDLSGSQIGPWKIEKYVHHLNNSPIWRGSCIYCNSIWDTTIPKFRKKKECDCEDSLKFTCGVFFPNDIFCWYHKKSVGENESFNLKYNDIIKMYLRQGGVDSNGNKLIFDFFWDYSKTPPTCNFIWPDLERVIKTSGYSLSNCYLVANPEDRFPRMRKKLLKSRGLWTEK
jgi:hypothetical protein